MKRRSAKKLTRERIVQPQLAAVIARHMRTGGLAYFSSEYLPLAHEMRRFFLHEKLFGIAPPRRVQRCRLMDAVDGTPMGLGGGDITTGDPDEEICEDEEEDGGGVDGAVADASAGVAPTEQLPAPQGWDGSVEPEGVPAAAASAGRAEDGAGGGGTVVEHGGAPWLEQNPFGCPTIREMFLYRSGRPVYRDLLVCTRGGFASPSGDPTGTPEGDGGENPHDDEEEDLDL